MGHPLREPQGRELELIGELRSICGELPRTDEQRDGFGHTVFKVGKRTFVMIGGGHGRGSLSIKSDLTTQDLLIRRGPWQRTPYIGQHGWVSVWGDDPIDWKEVRELVGDAYRMTAPKRLLRELGPQ
jgi:predicted DNA-binding protein (MmcQ/YjbR family)